MLTLISTVASFQMAPTMAPAPSSRAAVHMVAEIGDMVGMRHLRPSRRLPSRSAELIGNTPLLQLGRSAEGIDATILAKLESFEPCNSVKTASATR